MLGAMPLSFDDVARAPRQPGIYAWYHRTEISHADITNHLTLISTMDDEAQRFEETRRFLEAQIFAPLRETDYDVSISGKLKPRYEGQLSHRPSISKSLVKRFAEDPSRLTNLDQILRASTPLFASPIYIGVARKSLQSRLMRHRRLIQGYRESTSLQGDDAQATRSSDTADVDHSFAWEVTHVRRLNPSKLVVYTLTVDVDPDSALDAENILNRINYPLCGRQ